MQEEELRLSEGKTEEKDRQLADAHWLLRFNVNKKLWAIFMEKALS